MRHLARIGKEVLDRLFAAVMLMVLLPLLLVVAAAIVLESRGGPFYIHERLTRDGKVFGLIKFRTMVSGADQMGAGLSVEKQDPRITRLGRLWRATSLDELPQLINVLKGDMSLIGPRPLPPQYLAQWTPRERTRLQMKGGMTGWAQIHGRNEVPWDERLEMDAWYVENWSLGLDARVFWRSIWYVLARSGVTSQEGEVEELKR